MRALSNRCLRLSVHFILIFHILQTIFIKKEFFILSLFYSIILRLVLSKEKRRRREHGRGGG